MSEKSWYDVKLSDTDIIMLASNDSFVVNYDKARKMYRVSVFEDNHFLDEFWFDAYEEKNINFPSCSVGDEIWYNGFNSGPIKCRVSMLQQKSDASWKIRLTPPSGCVFDITLDTFNKHCSFDTK